MHERADAVGRPVRSRIRLLRAFVPLLAVALGCTIVALAGTGTGRVEGTVTVGSQLTDRRMRFSLYPEPGQAPPRQKPFSAADELRNVVVYLEAVPEGAAPAPRRRDPLLMGQERLTFEPHVLAVPKGTTVQFPNRDTVFHNVFSLSKVASFDLGRYPSGASQSVRFDKPGIVKVFCHIHSDMSAIILVLDNPFFATPESDGRFRIDGIPPGEYRVVAWHERARRATKRIRIGPGQASIADFNIPLTETLDGG